MTGKFEWQGFLKDDAHPHGKNPKSGLMVNWNNSVAHKFSSADDEWGRAGTVARVDMLHKMLEKNKRKGKWTMASVVSAMNAGATMDIRSLKTTPLLVHLLKGSKAPDETAAGMLAQMKAWNNNGSSRLDRNLDGLIDAPGAASMDGAWGQLTENFLDPIAGDPEKVISGGIANAFMKPKLGSQLDELQLAVLAVRSAAVGSVRRLVPVLRARHQEAARQEDRPVPGQLLRPRQEGQVPEGDLGRDLPGR